MNGNIDTAPADCHLKLFPLSSTAVSFTTHSKLRSVPKRMVRLRQRLLLLLIVSTVSLSHGLASLIQHQHAVLPLPKCSTLSCSQTDHVASKSKLMAQFSQTFAVTSMVLSISIQHLAATSPSTYRNPTSMQQYTISRERVIDVRNTPLSLQYPVIGEWKTLRTGAKIVARKYNKRLKVARIGAKLGVARSAMFCRLSLIRDEGGDH